MRWIFFFKELIGFKYFRLHFLGKNITIKILLAFMKILINSKDFNESRIRIIFWLRFFVTGRFSPVSPPHWMPENPRRFPVHVIGSFRNYFQDHRQLSEPKVQIRFSQNKTVNKFNLSAHIQEVSTDLIFETYLQKISIW
jgi:hypothetical protein